MKTRIGVLTSGGDCPGLNAVLRGVVLAGEKLGWEVIGFRDGFEGLGLETAAVQSAQELEQPLEHGLGGGVIGTQQLGLRGAEQRHHHARRKFWTSSTSKRSSSWAATVR